MKRKVIIKTRPRESALKIHEWTTEGGKKLNKTKLAENGGEKFSPMYASSVGGLQTGLLGKVENPFKDYPKDKLGQKWAYLSDLAEITLQEKLEYEHGRDPGFYTNRAPKEKEDPTFMSEFKIRLNDGTTVLDLNIPEHELAYYWALSTKYVANSKKDLDEGKAPAALYYIALDGEEDDLERTTNKKKDVAIAKLVSPIMTDDNLILVAKALGWYQGEGNTALYNRTSNRIKETSNQKLRQSDNDVDAFTKKASLLDTDEGRERLSAEALLFDLVKARVITESKGTYTWSSHAVTVGYSKADAVEFLLDPNKEDAIKTMRNEYAAITLR